MIPGELMPADGEIVLVVGPGGEAEGTSLQELVAVVEQRVAGGERMKQAAAQVAARAARSSSVVGAASSMPPIWQRDAAPGRRPHRRPGTRVTRGCDAAHPVGNLRP